MSQILSEDDIYRTSTQYRLWSFTPETLASLRDTTNKVASTRVIAAIRRTLDDGRAAPDNSRDGTPTKIASGTLVECLTPSEELKLITFYCEQCLKMGDHFRFPTNVKATAVQYMKRFYLSNSPMTYHPKLIFRTCLFLATKTENSYISLSNYASEFPKTTPEELIAPEFIITQGLRFTFEVRHPHRGLRGGLMELISMARGEAAVLPGLNRTAQQVQSEMLRLTPLAGAVEKHMESEKQTVKELENRCGMAHDAAKNTLAFAGILTDAYFLYTPAQMWMGAMLLADEPLTIFYLSTKICNATSVPGDTIQQNAAAHPLFTKLLTHLLTCAALLQSHTSALDPSSREELVRIDKKLYQCQNPEKRDLVSLNRAQKRNGTAEEDDEDDEEAKAKRVKKRKLERERAETDGGDVFGSIIS